MLVVVLSVREGFVVVLGLCDWGGILLSVGWLFLDDNESFSIVIFSCFRRLFLGTSVGYISEFPK